MEEIKESINLLGSFIEKFRRIIKLIDSKLEPDSTLKSYYYDLNVDLYESSVKNTHRFGKILIDYSTQLEEGTFFNTNIDDRVIIDTQYIYNRSSDKIKTSLDDMLNDALDIYLNFLEISKNVTGNAVDIVNEFTRTVKIMVNEMASKYPGDDIIIRGKKRVSLVTDKCPVFVVSEMGAHLFRYHKQIQAKDVRFFLENSYDKEMAHSIKTNPEAASLSAYLMPKVKESWKTLDEEEQDEYYKRIINLLSMSIQYQILTN
jgi:hypothetical protein